MAGATSGIETLLDIEVFSSPERQLCIDVIRPRGITTPLPAIVWLHGGGWYSGDKRLIVNRHGLDFLAEDGFVCVSAQYRLSTQATFPAQIDDVGLALNWLCEYGSTIGADAARIGIGGYSAGAHLATLAAAKWGAGVGSGATAEGDPNPIRCAFVMAPPTHLAATPYIQHASTRSLRTDRAAEELLLGGRVQDNLALALKASPITFLRRGAPPFFIIHGDRDQIVHVSQADLLYEKLNGLGALVSYVRVEGADHTFTPIDLPPTTDTWPLACMAWMRDFFGRHLAGRDCVLPAGKLRITVDELYGERARCRPTA